MKSDPSCHHFDAVNHASLPVESDPFPVAGDLAQHIEMYVLDRRVSGWSDATEACNRFWLRRLCTNINGSVATISNLMVQRFLSRLRERGLSESTVHQAYRVLKAFLGWMAAQGAISENPMRFMHMKTPATLPIVPAVETVVTVLKGITRETFEGSRNYAMVLLMVDTALRIGELLRLKIQDCNLRDATLIVRRGKGAKDRMVFISPTTVSAIMEYLARRSEPTVMDFVLVDTRNRPLTRRNAAQILHRLSRRVGLPRDQWLHPHGLRHFAATCWLRHGVGLDQVRRLLGHSTIQMTLRYSALVPADLRDAHRAAAVVERLGLGIPRVRSGHKSR
jgi:integrase/recombinase XerD